MNPTANDDTMQSALAHHQAGRLLQAEAIYRRVLQVEPGYPDAWHLLGLLAKQAGRNDLAATRIRRALTSRPDFAEARYNLGTVLQDQGGREAAVTCYRQALALKPDLAEAHMNMGNTLKEIGELTGAVASYGKALRLKPAYAEAHNNLGAVFKEQGKLDDAVASYRRSLQLKPDFVNAYANLGAALQEQGMLDEAVEGYRQALVVDPHYAEAYYNLGTAQRTQGRLEDCGTSYRRACTVKADYAEAHSNLGALLQEQGKLDEARLHCRIALVLEPGLAEAHSNLAAVLEEQGESAKAIDCCNRALCAEPECADAHNNLGKALRDAGEFPTARSCYLCAIELEPKREVFRFNLGELLLGNGDFSGWEGYEYRWEGKQQQRRRHPHPWWRGEDLGGKTMLVWGEQGVGDEMLFAGLIPDLTRRLGHCVLECEPRLTSLFARSFPGVEVLPTATPPQPRTRAADIALQCPAGSLPRWLRPDLGSFPQHKGYLVADLQRVAHWKRRLDALGGGTKVGICWTSANRISGNILQCTQLAQWQEILGVPGAVFVNLQYTDCEEELAAAEQRFGVRIHRWDDIDLKNDLDEVAALITALDRVVSVPSAVPLMAGALGRPVWMMAVRHAGWMHLGTDGLPWFPGMRLFQRDWDEDWSEVIASVARELAGR